MLGLFANVLLSPVTARGRVSSFWSWESTWHPACELFSMMFRTILCPVDFSADSRAALRYAATIAQRGQGHVTVLFVSDPLLAAAAAVAWDERKLAERTGVELRRFVTSVVGATGVGAVSSLVAMGDPAREIRKAARRLKSDLVVLGARGLGGAGKLFFGSTTERVLRNADFPVLAVPRAANRRAGPLRSWPTRVLAAIEPGNHAAADVRRAADVARWFKTPLLLLTVVPPVQTPSWLRPGAGAHERRLVLAARTRLRSLAARPGHQTVAIRVLTGDPAEQIAAASVDSGVGIIVLRLRPRGRLFGARQGTVTYRVLCSAALPVLALVEPRQRRGRR
jgi:nucleotide-binding universal stress UspA family protein